MFKPPDGVPEGVRWSDPSEVQVDEPGFEAAMAGRLAGLGETTAMTWSS